MRDPSYAGRYRYGSEAAIIPAVAEGMGGAAAGSAAAGGAGAGVLPAAEAGGMQGAAALGGGAPAGSPKGGTGGMLNGLNSGNTTKAAMDLMKVAQAGQRQAPAPPGLASRPSAATQPSVQGYLKMLQQRSPVTLRGIGGG